jgi:hypothetical protein
MCIANHINIRLFVVRVILNVPDRFKPFSKTFISQLCEIIIQGDLFGSGFNYLIKVYISTWLCFHSCFFKELVNLLIDWTSSDETLAKMVDPVTTLKFMRKIMKCVYTNSDESNSLKYNLLLVRRLIQMFKDCNIVAPTVRILLFQYSINTF